MRVTAHLYRAKEQQYVFNIDDVPAIVTPEYISELHKYFRASYPQHTTYLRLENV